MVSSDTTNADTSGKSQEVRKPMIVEGRRVIQSQTLMGAAYYCRQGRGHGGTQDWKRA